MKIVFAFLISIFICTSSVFAMNQAEHVNDKNLPLNTSSAKRSPDSENKKAQKVITVRIYTEEDCD